MTTTITRLSRAKRLSPVRVSRPDERLVWWSVGLVLAGRVALSAYQMLLPGLQQDETLFVNAATLRIPGWNITASLHGLPVMIFSYTGALKSWLYAPVFSVFGNSPASIRLPVIVITSAALALLYPAIRVLTNRPVAIASFWVLCFENSLFWLSRDDVGPSALDFFFKCAALLCVARFLVTRRTRWVAILVAALALGVFNKLNFIWIVNAAALISVLVIVRQRRSLRLHLRSLIVWLVGLTIVYAGFGAYYIGDHISRASPHVHGSLLAFTWPQFVTGMRAIISGTWFFNYALSPLGPRDVVVWIAVTLFGVGAVASIVPGRTKSLPTTGLALTALLIAAQILVTSAATAGWHYIEVYPFFLCVAAYGAYAAGQILFRSRRGALAALVGVLTAALAYNGVLMAKYERELPSHHTNPAWSNAIYQLDAFVQRPGVEVYSADWGIANPLFALHPDMRVHELAFALGAPAPSALADLGTWLESLPGDKIYVAHATGETVFPESTRNLLASMPGHLRLVHTIFDAGHWPMYFLYVNEVKPRR